MKLGIHLIVFVCVLTVVICGDGNVPPQLPPQPPPSPSPSPAPEPTPKPTSSPPPTTPSTKPTTPPSTTTSTPIPTKSTTPSIPTKPPTTKSTTPPPKSTTPEPPTPIPPKPSDPTKGTWHVNNVGSNVSCLLVQAAIQLKIPYTITNNNITYEAYVNVPTNATATGECGGEHERIVILWKEPSDPSSIALDYWKNSTTNKYFLQNIDIQIKPDADTFPNAKDNSTINLYFKQPEFETTVDKSYKCVKKQMFNLTDTSNSTRGVIYISDFQFEAFHNSTNEQFSSAEDCAPFDTPDIVPIAVGCALAALVLVVLAAYLIGRRRRQARGYLSMFQETKQEADYIPMKNLSCFK